MRWFDPSYPHGAQAARFADISAGKRKIPSWVPSRPEGPRRNESSLRPPKLPSEFVDAVRQELDQEYAPRMRASMVPDAIQARLSERPAAAPASVAEPHPQPIIEPAAPVVDPALILAFERGVVDLASERERVFAETAAQIAELAVLIARRVIGRELSLNPSIVRGLVREGLSALGQHDRAQVRLGPGFESQRERLEADFSAAGTRADVRFDPTLEAYGCYVETELGQVDESIESRLETLLLALKPDPENS
ncbi:MAG TPA: FliH/SctL family protein [Polyangiaceae bacterium]|nr:FliH/SctL family protein [Polyangiaceae bacterium]